MAFKKIDFSKLPRAGVNRNQPDDQPDEKRHYVLVDNTPQINAVECFEVVRDIALSSGAQIFLRHSYSTENDVDTSSAELTNRLVIPFLEAIGIKVLEYEE